MRRKAGLTMVGDSGREPTLGEDLQYLKQVSRIKHEVLENYLGPWLRIMAKGNSKLAYLDCFAGRGLYLDENREPLPGSPVIALTVARKFFPSPTRSVVLGFVEKDDKTAQRLERTLALQADLPNGLRYFVIRKDAQNFVEELINWIKETGTGGQVVPTFFFVDPYGHPISLPVIRKLLSLGKTEILVNLMWFRICMDLDNSKAQPRLDFFFGHNEWREQRFMSLRGWDRERAFLDYVVNQVGTRHVLVPVPYSPEDKVRGKDKRTKFYLVHFSNHSLAALIMKEVMWAARDKLEELKLIVQGGGRQISMFNREPDIDQLGQDLLNRFPRRRIDFRDMRSETLEWQARETHYRQAVKRLEEIGAVRIDRRKSKQTGLAHGDIVIFP